MRRIITSIAWFYYLALNACHGALGMLKRCIHETADPDESTNGSKRPVKVLILISRPQDVPLLADIYLKASKRDNISLVTWILSSCYERDPGIANDISNHGIVIDKAISHLDIPWISTQLMTIDAYLNTRESTAGRYRLPDIITDLANAAGTHSYTLQHGFENPGLTYCDQAQDQGIRFAARTILTWGPVELLPEWLSKDTRQKCIAVGCPKEFDKPEASAATHNLMLDINKPLIVIFENLQWRRFDSEYISGFFDAMKTVTSQRNEFDYVLKSHPGAAKNRTIEITDSLKSMDNIHILDHLDPATTRPSTSALLSHATAIITTPSTIAVDAALAHVPVAMVQINLDLSAYYPLPMLDSPDDWHGYLDRVLNMTDVPKLRTSAETFLERAILPGDAGNRIMDLIVSRQLGSS